MDTVVMQGGVVVVGHERAVGLAVTYAVLVKLVAVNVAHLVSLAICQSSTASCISE